MRDIKFRARKSTGEWAYFTLDQLLTHDLNVPNWVWEYPLIEKQQYIGLKDKSGNEIYEGDICAVTGGWSGNQVQHMYPLDNHHFWGEVDDNIKSGATYEVIGNVYENPDFLNP